MKASESLEEFQRNLKTLISEASKLQRNGSLDLSALDRAHFFTKAAASRVREDRQLEPIYNRVKEILRKHAPDHPMLDRTDVMGLLSLLDEVCRSETKNLQ